MKDGFATVYIPEDEFFDFIRKYADLKDDAMLVIGRPFQQNPDEIEVKIAFSETEVHPDDWCGEPGEKVKEVKSSWRKL